MRKLLLSILLSVALVTTGTISYSRESSALSRSFSLENGMDVVVIPIHKSPIVSHMVWYRVGAIDDPKGSSGLAHFLEHLMFKGTNAVKEGEFSRIIAQNGGKDNAFTSYDFTAYHQTLSKENLELAMKLEADRMKNLRFNQKTAENEREIVLEERRMRTENNPSVLLIEKMYASLFSGHKYEKPVIGAHDEIKQLSAAAAHEFYKKYYSPGNAILVIAGDVKTEEVRSLAEKYYGAVASSVKPGRHIKLQTAENIKTRRIIHKDPKVTIPELIIYYLAPSLNTAHNEHAHPLVVLSHILGGGKTSRLYKSLVEEQKIAAHISSSYDDVALGQSILSIYAIPKNSISAEIIEKAVDLEISRLLQNGITDYELTRAKNSLKAEAIYAQDSVENMAYIYGEALATGLDANYVENWRQSIDSVSKDDIATAATFILQEKNRVTGTLLPEDKTDDKI